MSPDRTVPSAPRPLLALALAGALLTGCAAAGAPAGSARLPGQADGGPVDTERLPAELTGQRLDWEECPPPAPAQGEDAEIPAASPGGTAWRCAALTVPVDYADPGGDTLRLALIRAAATGDGDRAGALVFNFGGPGGSGVVSLPAFADRYRPLQDGYDLVSFDPRGVGGSSGVVCLDDRELDAFFAAEPTPADDAEARELVARTEAFAASCRERTGALLPHLTTENTARDLDLLRAVLGDERLHYVGVSYGTQLGGVYAHLFRERLGRAVFDAVVDPAADDLDGALGQAEGFQLALGAYLDDCAGQEDCPLGGDPARAERRLAELLDGLRADPMPTGDPDRPLTRALAWSGVAQSLYSTDFWPYLTQGLADALDAQEPDGSILRSLGDAMHGRASTGRYSTLQSSLTAIRCADSDARHTVADVRRRLPEFERASPVFGPVLAWSLLGCAGWPVTGAGAPEVAAEGAGPILLIGTTGDPATPYAGTAAMRQALGEDVAHVITYEGADHGAYLSGDRCVTRATDRFLLHGTLPEDGLTCP